MLKHRFLLIVMTIPGSGAWAEEPLVAKVTLSPVPPESLSEVLFNHWGIGSPSSPYRLYGQSGWVKINTTLRNDTHGAGVVFIPSDLVRPTDNAIFGKLTSDGTFLPHQQEKPPQPSKDQDIARPDVESCPDSEPRPPVPAPPPSCDCEPVPLSCPQTEPVPAAVEKNVASSYQWEVSGSIAIAQTETSTEGVASKPVERREVSGEGVSLYIFGPWARFFSVGLGPSVALTSVRTEQSQSISDGFTSEEKNVKTEQSIYSLGLRSHFYFQELGPSRSVPFLGLSYRYSVGTESESGTPDADLSGFGYAGLAGYHVPLFDAVSLSPALRYDVSTLERTSGGETISQTTRGLKFSLGLSVFF